jgi:hypothetical protein
MNYWAIAYLRPFQSVQLAVTGDSIQRMILAEYTLTVSPASNEAAGITAARSSSDEANKVNATS